MKEKCYYCGKKTKYMYKLNKGLFCEKHYKIALEQQNFDLHLEYKRGFFNS